MKKSVLSALAALTYFGMVAVGSGCIIIDGSDPWDDDPPYNGDPDTGWNSGDDDDDDTTHTPGNGVGPASGTWEYITFETTLETCGDSHQFDTGQSSGDFEVINHEDGTFTIDPLTGADPYLCQAYDDGTFDCEAHVAAETDFHPEKNAVVTAVVQTSGTYECTDTMAGDHIGDIDCGCDGATDDCDRLAWAWDLEFPCYHDVTWTAAPK